MFVIMICWIFVLLVLRGPNVESSSPYCDPEDNMLLDEGNLGQTQTFPWLGVLRVHLHHETSLKIALTGIVLVKEGYAIANADDIARIPKRIFQDDSRAMFLPHDESPWFCKVKDFMTHPEYEFETLNTVALIELDMTETRVSPIRPICWPPYSYNVSDHLYAAGYTDENQMLEKMLYKLQYVEQNLCQEYYARAGLTEGKKAPTHLQCGFAVNNEANCVWDNGMALISNTTGYWILIGLSLHGPGCAAPARFIDLLTYYPWVESSTSLQDVDYGSPNYRKSAFGEGFKRPYRSRYGSSSASSEVENIPAHELLRSGPDNKVGGKQEFAHYYPYSTVLTTNPFKINRINSTEIEIHDRNASTDKAKLKNNQSYKPRTMQTKKLIVAVRAEKRDEDANTTTQVLISKPKPLDDTEYGQKINEDLAKIWHPILKNGIPELLKQEIILEYLVPYNCKLLKAPKLNTEISAIVPNIVKNRDKVLLEVQQQLGVGITALNRGMDILSKIYKPTTSKAMRHLINGCRLLSDLHYIWSQVRIQLMKPSIEKVLFNIIQHNERDDTLFGKDLIDKIEYAKSFEKQRIQYDKALLPKARPTEPPILINYDDM